jgi:nucleotide-binding universal stress UspA family protein
MVVAVSPTEGGFPLAAVHARGLAKSANAEMLLVSAVASRGRGQALGAALKNLDELAQSMRAWGATVSVTAVSGKPAHAAVLAAANEWDADLLVVGAHEARSRGGHFGHTARQLLRFAECPLLLVKDPFFDGYATILAAVDPVHDSAALDTEIMAVARAVGAGLGSKLRVVSAYTESAGLADASVEVDSGVFLDALGLERLEGAAVEQLARNHDVAPEAIDLRAGEPHEVIQAVAALRGAELLVVGARSRRNPLTAAVAGTAEIVADDSSCDVLLVPPPGSSENTPQSAAR